MNSVSITNVVVSKGFEDKPAIRYNNNENGDVSSAFFRIGEKVYDKRAQDNYRWNNWNVKAFGNLAERIQKMKLNAGSFINITGRLDIDTWEDNGEKRSAPVIILTEVEYCYAGNKNGSGNNENGNSGQENTGQGQAAAAPQQNAAANPAGNSSNFTGYEGFGGGMNPFFPE